MNISYSGPLSSAWMRMNNILFRPFNLSTWFGLGFAAFLASLADGGGGGGNSGTQFSDNNWDTESWDGSVDSLQDSFEFFNFDGVAAGLVFFFGMLALVLMVVFIWLSSRGQFMFLDNLVNKRSEVVRPWKEFRGLGHSLFLWQLVFAVVVLVVIGLGVLLALVMVLPAAASDAGWGVMAPIAIILGTLFFILIMALCYIDYFLSGFVVPIMYKHQVGTMRAWGIFMALFREHPGEFVLSGLFYFLISLLGGLAVFLAGVVTCCIGLLLMAIPYIGSVITLPYSVTLRYYTLDFLGQFGDDYRLLGPAVYEPAPGGPGGPEGTGETYGQYDFGTEPDQGSAPEDTGDRDLIQFDTDGTVIGPEDVGEDGGGNEPRPQG